MLLRSVHPSQNETKQAGFTLLEMLITTILVALAATTFMVLFRSTLFSFLRLQTNGTTAVTLNSQANRIGMVLRGATDITSASANDLVVYSYFYPSDSYVSLLHYYLRTSNGTTQLVADLTPMSANPPTGTPLTASKRTFVIIENYHQVSGTDLFTYMSANGTPLALPVSDLQAIKGIKVTLSSNAYSGSYQQQNVQVTLRNRKTNL
ncbi:MAG: hypothetical protein QG629_302 [Patescibacteria group bacterium]|nr:type II secretion system protein [Candidatus Saccharibacteria bacterium]MDQ5963220.1 hypothetical protein [Patescibacteria group bacterium]